MSGSRETSHSGDPAVDRAMADYRLHYQTDAEAIVGPEELDPLRRASEERRFETLVRLLDPKEGEWILEAGCGSGWLAACCRRRGGRVCAMDIGLVGVMAARRRFPEVDAFQVGDLYHLPFSEDSFDALVLSEVLEHLEWIDQALAEARRVLRPGGRIVVSVPYREKIVHHLCIHCNRFTPANAHLHSFDEARLEAHLLQGGFSVERRLLVSNKLLEMAGFPRWSRQWPYRIWRGMDHLFNRLLPRPAFLCALAIRKG